MWNNDFIEYFYFSVHEMMLPSAILNDPLVRCPNLKLSPTIVIMPKIFKNHTVVPKAASFNVVFVTNAFVSEVPAEACFTNT